VNRITRLLETPAVALDRFDHAPGVVHRDPDREVADGYGVSFVEAGSFRLRVGTAQYLLTPESLFVTTPGLVFSCEHDEEQPADECLSMAYSEATVEQLRGAGATRVPPPFVPPTHRRAYLRRRLGTCGRGDEARVEALAGAVYFALTMHPRGRSPFHIERFSWYAARVDRAKELMDANYADPLSLTVMAREVGMSTYHFARVFRELEGEPPHRYLTAVRLSEAAARLDAGASVTETCFAVGFGSLSHFVTTFRRRYGIQPSAVRRRSARRFSERAD
jgi:AraC-like DNA-binding protein